VGNKQRIREIESPKYLLEEERGGQKRSHFNPIHRRWYILTRKLTLAVTTEAGVLLREVKAPCAKNQRHRFELILQHSARDRLLRTHCKQCMVLWDIGSPDKEIPHLFGHHVLQGGEQCPYTVVSSSCDVAKRKVVVYKSVDYASTLRSSVVMDMDHPEAERQEVKFEIPLYSEILLQTYGDRLALYGGRQQSGIRIVQLNSDTKEHTDLHTFRGSIATCNIVDTNLIACHRYDNNRNQLHYVDISTREVNAIPGPVLPNDIYTFCQTVTGEGDLHLMLVPGKERFEFELLVMSMRRGKQIRNWTFKVPDPDPANTERASHWKGCDSVDPYYCHGMMVCGSEVLIDLGLHDCYSYRILALILTFCRLLTLLAAGALRPFWHLGK